MSAGEVRFAEVKRRRHGLEVRIEGVEESFRLPEELAMRHRLQEGGTMARAAWWALVREAEAALCWEKLLTLLDQRFHAVGELRRKLFQRRFPRAAIDAAIAKAEALALVDDRRFAELYVEEKLGGRFRSRRQLAAELRKRGVAGPLIDEILDEQPEAFGADAARDEALAFARQRERSLVRETDPRKKRDKLLRMLAYRGYPRGLCFEVADAVLGKRGGDSPPPWS